MLPLTRYKLSKYFFAALGDFLLKIFTQPMLGTPYLLMYLHTTRSDHMLLNGSDNVNTR